MPFIRRSIRRFNLRRSVAAAVFLAVTWGTIFLQTTAQESYWTGRIELDNWTWDIGLLLDERGEAGSGVTVDFPSRWRIGETIEDYNWSEDELSFHLPQDMGRMTLKLDTTTATGEVDMGDHGIANVLLTRSKRPAISEIRFQMSRNSDGASIGASIYLPDGEGPFPAAVVVHGGGNSSREVDGYRFWGEWLAMNGIAALIYDKRGNGESESDWRSVDFYARTGDVEAGVAQLRSADRVDTDRICLVAVSQGTWIADIVAASDDQLSCVVQISGPVVPVSEADAFAIESRLRGTGADDETVDEYLALWFEQVGVLTRPDDIDRFERLRASVDAASEHDWFSRFPYRIGNPQGWWWTWYGLVGDFDPAPYLDRISASMLWIYGDVDTQSDTARNVSILQDRRGANRLPAVKVFPQSGHGIMAPADKYGNPLGPITVAPGFFDTVFNWIHQHH